MIDVGKPEREEIEIHPLGLLGIGPFLTSRRIPGRSRMVQGRSVWKDIEVDFEEEKAVEKCLIEVGPHDVRKVNEPFVLTFEGITYVLFGLFPLELQRSNVWRCSIDYAIYADSLTV